MRLLRRALKIVTVVFLLVFPSAFVVGAKERPAVHPGPVPRANCGPGSRPEIGRQGRVSSKDVDSGRAARGFTCNTQLVGHFGTSGGYKVYRYRDRAGHECAYYDTTLLFPIDAPGSGTDLTGVYVLDMSNPRRPVRTESLLTPAMQSPHESLSFNPKRGLLAAVMGNPFTYPGVVDIYDVSQDCRHPVLRSSTPVGIMGHEGNFAPDGKTFYASATGGGTLTAIDVSNPSLPVTLWAGAYKIVHGFHVSDDGNRLYYADILDPGLTILDVSQIQKRVSNPEVPVVSHLSWDNVSIPQTAIPVTIRGHRYLVEVDEFNRDTNGNPDSPVGAARIIDIVNDRKPKVISNIRLEVHMPRNRRSQMNDPGASSGLQGYAAHYCAVPQRHEPGIVACSFILSGLRVFDIRDPYHPKEIAYFNAPREEDGSETNYAMSGPAFNLKRGEIWYSDGNSGFWAVRVTNGVWPL